MAFQPGGIYVASGDHALRTTFVRCRNVQPRADQPLQEKGPATALNRVTYPQLWDGVSLTYEAVEGGIVKSTFRLDPRARVEDIRLRYNAPLKVDKAGALHLAYAMGEMNESTPVAWQDINGRRLPVTAAFRLYSQYEAGFTVGKYDPAYPLVIDPILTWTSFLGAGSYDAGHAVAVSYEGAFEYNWYYVVVGTSENTWGGSVRAHSGGRDVFVAKFDHSGNRVWHTFLGSSSTDEGHGVVVDGSFNVYVSGYSSATWGVPLRDYEGSGDAFVAKLSRNGRSAVEYVFRFVQFRFRRKTRLSGSGNLYLTGVSECHLGGPRPRTWRERGCLRSQTEHQWPAAVEHLPGVFRLRVWERDFGGL